jgi:PAS domain S-box-containing protein
MPKMSLDITMQQFAEEKFRLAVESSPNGVVMTDRDGKIMMVNTEIERLFGYTRGELVDRAVTIIVPDWLSPQHVRDRSEFNAQPGIRRMGVGQDVFGLRKDGSKFPIEIGLNPIRVGEDLFFVLSAIVDVSQRKHAEEMFRLAVEACPSGMIMVDDTGKIVMINTEIERLFGYTSGELIGQADEILVPERLRPQHVHYRSEFATSPEARRKGTNRGLFGLRKDGTEFPVEVGLNPIRVGSGLLVLSVIVDISERKRMDRLKDEFVSTVSHELRTPMTSIAGSLGLLVGGAAGVLPEPATRLLDIAHSNCQRMVRLINDILDIQKLESGRVVFNLTRIEVRSLVEQTVEAMRGFAEGFDVRLRLDGSSVSAEVSADTDRLAQVVTNLLSNAIKFSPSGQEVVIAVVQRGDSVIISVRDHGQGIPDEFKQRIFEKFAQADGTDTRMKGGTGLGLSIVKQIVLRLGGQVTYGDGPDCGTIFSVELPAWDKARDASSQLGEVTTVPVLPPETYREPLAVTPR